MEVRNISDILRRSAERFPERPAVRDEDSTISYKELYSRAQGIAATLTDVRLKPVAVYLDKSAACIPVFWGIILSGGFYCPIDVEMPVERAVRILSVLKPDKVITDHANEEKLKKILLMLRNKEEEILSKESEGNDAGSRINDKILLLENMESLAGEPTGHIEFTGSDPMYTLFTSGSTGMPKGVTVPERVILSYLTWLSESFSFSENDVFGNQAPLYFDISVHDIFGAAYFGACCDIIPPRYFAFPMKLMEYMNEHRISTFLWVPSAMTICSQLKVFRAVKPMYLRHVMFAGEVLQGKVLSYWKDNLSDVVFANLYGPTETFVSTAYICQGNEDLSRPLPIGKAIKGSETLIFKEDGTLAEKGEEGELCLRGDCLAMGYFGDRERTENSFTQNPIFQELPDRIYHTGDLVKELPDGNLEYISRKDFQIKLKGYRIEPGEIEVAAASIPGVCEAAAIYEERKGRIVLFYSGEKQESSTVMKELELRLPQYMVPGKCCYLEALPHNRNGKIDRKALKEIL